jgi:Flp pilus assembly protein TadD
VATAAAAGPSSEVLMVQGMIRQAMGKWQDAIRLFQQLLRAEPANVEAYRLLADTWDRAGHQKEAEESFHEALRLRPGYAGLYNSLGDFYSRHGLYSQAEQAFSTGLGLTPESPSMYYNLGANYFRMGRWADAGRAFEKSLAIKPTALAYANLGTVRFYEGNYAEAARQCEAATRLQPANPVNWGNLGDSLWQIAGERDKARAAFEKASTLATQQLSVNPNNPALRKLLALYLAKQGRSAEADAEIHRAQQQAPNDGSIAFYEARIYAVEGNADAVFASLKKSLAQGYSAKEVQQEPDFAPLRKDPRYGEILAQGKAPK